MGDNFRLSLNEKMCKSFCGCKACPRPSTSDTTYYDNIFIIQTDVFIHLSDSDRMHAWGLPSLATLDLLDLYIVNVGLEH